MKTIDNGWVHWENRYRHPDGREMVCAGDYREGTINYSEFDCNLKMSMAGFVLEDDGDLPVSPKRE
jgi:hypothetical protein